MKLEEIRSLKELDWLPIALKVPESATFSVTTTCNLACKYCYESLKNTRREGARPGVAEKLVEFIFKQYEFRSRFGRSRGAPSIHLFGGEPTLAFDEIKKAVLLGRKLFPGFRFSMTSNLTLIDNDMAEFLKRFNISILGSIDGTEDVHDAYRIKPDGSGSFHDAIRGFNILRSHGVKIEVRGTVMPDTVDRLYDSLIFLESLGVPFVIFPAFEPKWDDDSISTFEDNLKRYALHWLELLRKGNAPRNGNIRHCIRLATQTSNNGPCGLGDRTLGVAPDGRFVSCHRLTNTINLPEKMVFGDVFDGFDLERFQASLEWPKRKPRSLAYDCSRCPLRNICTGQCIAANYQITGCRWLVPKSTCDLLLAEWRCGVFLRSIGGELIRRSNV